MRCDVLCSSSVSSKASAGPKELAARGERIEGRETTDGILFTDKCDDTGVDGPEV